MGAFSVTAIILTILNQMRQKTDDKKKALNKQMLNSEKLLAINNKDSVFKDSIKPYNLAKIEQKNFDSNTDLSNVQDMNTKNVNELKETLVTQNEMPPTPKTEKVHLTTFEEVMNFFDIVRRAPTLIVSKRVNAESASFDIVRIISMGWVVLAHGFSERMSTTIDFTNAIGFFSNLSSDWNITFIEHGFYAVDFFLFMGGFVGIISLRRIIFDYKNSA